MSYKKQNFESGQKLYASQLNHIEDGIVELSEEIVNLKNSIGNDEDDGIGRLSGTVISARDALAKAPLLLKVYGRTTQEGVPSEATPVAPTNSNENGLFLYRRGKNLVNVPDKTLTVGGTHDLEQYINAANGVIQGNTYTVSYRIKSVNVKTAMLRIVVYDLSQNIIADTKAQNITEGHKSLTFTYKTTPNKIYFYLSGGTAGDTITITQLQIELGNHATAYEPYDTAKSTHLWASMPGGLAGVPVTSGGNYTDETGQEWACDMVDLTGGILERRCATIASYAGEPIPGAYISSTGALTTGAKVVYALAEPATSNLAASVVNEYNAIVFPTPALTLYSNGMAWVAMEYERDIEVEPEPEKEAAAAFDPTIWGMPMLWLYGDTEGMNKDDAVTLNWRYKNMEGECTCKWQGSSSIWFDKKNYTIKFDQDFEVVEGWGAQNKYCFKANYIDHSHARNICCARLWGQVTKSRSVVPTHFANLVNGGAVDGFPCILMLNDEFHGLYTWNIPKDGWMMGMGNGEREAIVCADNDNDEEREQTRFRNTLSELGGAFEIEYCPDENNTGWILESLNRLITACINSDGSDLDTTIAQYLDWDSAIDSYIFTVLISGHDNVVRNYLLVTYDGVKWYWVQYDMDETFGQIGSGQRFKNALSPDFLSNATWHRVYELIKLYKKDELKARYEQLRNGVMNELNVHGVVGNFVNQIPPAVLLADLEKYPTIPSANASNMAQMLHFYGLTVDSADKAIESL